MRVLYPGAFGFTLLTLFLALSKRDENLLFGTLSEKILLIVVLLAATISHFPTSAIIFLILTSVYLLQVLGRTHLVNLTTVAIAVTLLLSWEIYYAVYNSGTLAAFLPKLRDDLFAGQFLAAFLDLGGANIGQRLPLWANAIPLMAWFTDSVPLEVKTTSLGSVQLIRPATCARAFSNTWAA